MVCKKRKCVNMSNKHNMKLDPYPYELIKSGEKTIELRLWDNKRRKIKIDDTIVFTNTKTEQTVSAKVINLHRFSTFEELYASLPLLKCGYTLENVDTAHYTDMEKYYSAQEQKRYGVLGIELLICNNDFIQGEEIL